MERYNVVGKQLPELEAYMESIGEPRFRAGQLMNWVYKKGAASFSEITVFSNELRMRLSDEAIIGTMQLVRVDTEEDGTSKLLLGTSDGQLVESVLMKYTFGNTACISSQVGCRMACSFCATGKGGFVRNLSRGEMVEQVLIANRISEDDPMSRVVMMGMGEPLNNYDESVGFLRLLHDKSMFDISYRRMTISTCGIVPGIRRLVSEGLPINLAISLHSPDNEQRSKLVPANRKYNIHELIEACREYVAKTNRRITFEYILLAGINDSKGHAHRLAELLSGILCHVNLIPYNEIKEMEFKASSRADIEGFKAELENLGVNATIRRSLGSRIQAACGQLRRRERT